MTADWDAPSPGRKEVKGAVNVDAIRDLNIDFFESLMWVNFDIFWIGIFVFWLILIIKFEAPNNPVNKGRRGWDKFRFKVISPKSPANKKINKVCIFCFSDKIKCVDINIRIMGINFKIAG